MPETLPDSPSQRIAIPCTRGMLSGRLYPAPLPASAPLLIMCHGFADTQDSLVERAQALTSRGLSCLTFDFIGGAPGSASGGTMSDMSILTQRQELNAVIDWALAYRPLPFTTLALSGDSQGGLVAGLVAGQRSEDIRALVLFYPALTLPGNIRKQYPQGKSHTRPSFLGFEVGHRYVDEARCVDAYGQVSRYAGPILIYHGTKDELVPLESSRRFAREHHATRLEILEGVGHGIHGAWRIERICDEIAQFIREI